MPISGVQPSVQDGNYGMFNWETQKWEPPISSFSADSKGQWSLAQKVGVFFLCALGVWVLSKMFRVNHTVTRTSSDNSTTVSHDRSTRTDVSNRRIKFTNGSDSLPLTRDAGEIKVENWSIGAFHAIQVNVPGQFTITLGDPYLSLAADKNICEKLEYRVRDNTLIIQARAQTAFETNRLIQYIIHVPNELKEIKVTTAAQVTIPHLDGDEFLCTIKGAGKVFVQAGNVRMQEISVSGTGSYNAGSVLADHSIVNIEGAGNAYVKARQILDVKIKDTGTCTCNGNPAKINKQISTTGQLIIQTTYQAV